MLIDDNEYDHFINSWVIKKADITKKIITFNSGKNALAYLNEINLKNHIKPNLILLDINMPLMNGWEFLIEYEKLDVDIKKNVVIMMLSTSLDFDDNLSAQRNELLSGFLHKPLTEKHLVKLLKIYFKVTNDQT